MTTTTDMYPAVAARIGDPGAYVPRKLTPSGEPMESVSRWAARAVTEGIRPMFDELHAEVERLRAYEAMCDELRAENERLRMFEKRCFEIQELLDQALGTEESDGAGEGIVQDVYLLAQQRDVLRPVAEAAKEWAETYVNPTGGHAGLAEAKLFEAVKSLPNEQEPCGICSGNGCPDCRDDVPGVTR